MSIMLTVKQVTSPTFYGKTLFWGTSVPIELHNYIWRQLDCNGQLTSRNLEHLGIKKNDSKNLLLKIRDSPSPLEGKLLARVCASTLGGEELVDDSEEPLPEFVVAKSLEEATLGEEIRRASELIPSLYLRELDRQGLVPFELYEVSVSGVRVLGVEVNERKGGHEARLEAWSDNPDEQYRIKNRWYHDFANLEVKVTKSPSKNVYTSHTEFWETQIKPQLERIADENLRGIKSYSLLHKSHDTLLNYAVSLMQTISQSGDAEDKTRLRTIISITNLMASLIGRDEDSQTYLTTINPSLIEDDEIKRELSITPDSTIWVNDLDFTYLRTMNSREALVYDADVQNPNWYSGKEESFTFKPKKVKFLVENRG